MVTERQRKSRLRIPVYDNLKGDGEQADEEPLANLESGTTLRRSAVVSNASRRCLIENDQGRRHSMHVRRDYLYAPL